MALAPIAFFQPTLLLLWSPLLAIDRKTPLNPSRFVEGPLPPQSRALQPRFRRTARSTTGLSKRQLPPEDIRHHNVRDRSWAAGGRSGTYQSSKRRRFGRGLAGGKDARRHRVGQCLVRAIGKIADCAGSFIANDLTLAWYSIVFWIAIDEPNEREGKNVCQTC